MTVYVSSIYGMFDQVAAAPLLAALALAGSRPRLASLLLGAAVAVKQTLLFPALATLVYLVRVTGASAILLAAAPPLASLAPLLAGCPRSVDDLVSALAYPLSVYYPEPLAYNLNGATSLITYLHESGHLESGLAAFRLWWAPALTLLTVILLRGGAGASVLLVASASYIVFVLTYWRVNPQYMVPLVALIVPLIAGREGLRVKLPALLLVAYVGLWPLMFPLEWWFIAHIQSPNWALVRAADLLSLGVRDDLAYVAYSLALTALEAAALASMASALRPPTRAQAS